MMNQSDNNKPRTLIRQGQVVRHQVQKVSSAKIPLENALTILDQQVERLLIKSSQNQTLLPEETKALHGHIKALVEISREEREAAKFDPESEKFANMTDEQLLEAFKKSKDALLK